MCLFLASVFITQHAIVFTVFGKRKIVAKHVTDPTVYGKREILYISDQIIFVTDTAKKANGGFKLTKLSVGFAVGCKLLCNMERMNYTTEKKVF